MTPQTITKSECEAMIDKLADKTLSFGCVIAQSDKICTWKIVGQTNHGVMKAYTKYMMFSQITGAILTDEAIRKDEINLGHPVLIGDVLEKLKEKTELDNDMGDVFISTNTNAQRIICLWFSCGFTKSLNQILEEALTKASCDFVNNTCSSECEEVLKNDTPQSNLFLFLNQLFN